MKLRSVIAGLWLGCAAGAGAEVTVDRVAPKSEAAKVGIESGDRLRQWSRSVGVGAPADGTIRSALDLEDVRFEQAPRGAVRIELDRGSKIRVVELGEGSWGIELRFDGPVGERLASARRASGDERRAILEPLVRDAPAQGNSEAAWLAVELARLTENREEAEALLERATGWTRGDRRLRAALLDELTISRLERGDGESAVTSARTALADRRAIGESGLRLARSSNLLASALIAAAQGDDAESPLREAERIAAALAPDSAQRAQVQHDLGRWFQTRDDLDDAAGWYGRAIATRERIAPGSIELAGSLNNLGNVERRRGDLAAAEALHRRALEIKRVVAPASVTLAGSYLGLGTVLEDRGELDQAEAMYGEASGMLERVAPGSPSHAAAMNNLGIILEIRGDLVGAERAFGRVREIRERLQPGSISAAFAYRNLGNVALLRGDLEAAERWYRRDLEIMERLAPDGFEGTAALENLAGVFMRRGELDTAIAIFRRAVETIERFAPESLELATTLRSLSAAERARGNWDASAAALQRALEIRQAQAPDGIDVADSLGSAAELELDRGHLVRARELAEQALVIRLARTPESFNAAIDRRRLAEVAAALGDFDAARAFVRGALLTLATRAPESADEAKTWWTLGRVERAAGNVGAAIGALRCAIEALEAQQRRLGGSPDDLSRFRAYFLPLYRELLELAVERGNPSLAFDVIEKARARALLALIAERDLRLADAPAELEAERRRLAVEAEAALAELSEAEGDEREALERELATIRLRQEDLAARWRVSSPKSAAVRYPEPLAAAEASRRLPPDAVLLAWMTGSPRSYLVALAPSGISCWQLGLDERALGQRIRRLRADIEGGGDGSAELARLSEQLLGPARALIAAARELVLLPDGPLWLLPFAALPDPAAPGRRLVETRSLTSAPSATLALGGGSARRAKPSVAAFGDPDYPAEAVTLRRGPATLARLPATRREVETVAELFGGDARTWLGGEADESALRAAVAAHPSILHLAAHGIVDERFPLESAIALSMRANATAESDGLLKAWEIAESLRLDADLVVLSACETALGREQAGEGVIGLVRAFEIAGAESVLASLWSVADRSTAELMERFYRGVHAGESFPEALRRAQRELAAAPIVARDGQTLDATLPFHWAPFVLIGRAGNAETRR